MDQFLLTPGGIDLQYDYLFGICGKCMSADGQLALYAIEYFSTPLAEWTPENVLSCAPA